MITFLKLLTIYGFESLSIKLNFEHNEKTDTFSDNETKQYNTFKFIMQLN